jgi:hypothetical protein
MTNNTTCYSLNSNTGLPIEQAIQISNIKNEQAKIIPFRVECAILSVHSITQDGYRLGIFNIQQTEQSRKNKYNFLSVLYD